MTVCRGWRRAICASIVFGLMTALSLASSSASALTTTTTALTSGVNPSQLAQSTTLKATVSPSAVTGTVTFKDGTTTLGTGTLSSGVATYAATFSTTGSHTLTAVYAGSSTYATSTSSALTQTVNTKTTTTALTSSVNPSQVSQSTTLKATVTPTTATGTVTFKDGTTTLGTGTLASGVATYAATFSATGTHSLTAVYAGDTSDAASTSSTLTQTVNTKTTTTALTSSVNPSQLAQSTTLKATVTPTTATGTVTFKDGTATLGTSTLASGVATFAATFSTTGTHSIAAVYAGDASDSTSTSSALTQTVNTNTTKTVLTSSVNPSQLAQSTTLTATVTPTTATGTVTFKDGTSTLGTGSLTSGIATYAATFSTTGTHSLTAVYAGDTNDVASTSSALTQAVNKKTTTTALTSSANPNQLVQYTTLTATVTPATATGTVTFKDGTTTLGTGTLASGVATYGTSFSYVGTYNLTAVYGGDSSDATSTSTALAQTVGPNATTIALSSSNPTLPVGASTALVATVRLAQCGTCSTATGLVTFMDGTTSLGSASLSNGVASIQVSFAATGTHSLTATYAGDANDLPNTSSAVSETVVPIGTTPSTVSPISTNYNPVVALNNFYISVTVAPSNATGTVIFKDGTTTLATLPVSSGTAGTYMSLTTFGAHSLQAVYSGDATYASNSSPVLVETVIGYPTTTSLTSVVNPVIVGQSTTLTATLSPSYVKGSVTFMDGATVLGASTVSSGVAVFPATFNTVGAHNLTAVYGGASQYATSTSSTLTQSVGYASTTTLASGLNPTQLQQGTTLTATVTPSTASGIVKFMDGATTLGTGTLASGIASYAATFSAIGVHALTAVYSGDATDVTSTSSAVTETVTTNSTTTALTSSMASVASGQSTVLTATVTPSTATGTVTFMDGATTLGTGTLTSGVATYSATFGTAGSHNLTAIYGGDSNNTASTSNAVRETAMSSTLSLTPSANPIAAGSNLTLLASVVGSSPTGTVQFMDGTASIGSPVTLVSGQASYSFTPSSAAGHLYGATYSGDTNNSTSSGQVAVNVTGATSTTSLSSSAIAATPTTSVTLTANVTGSSPTGNVVFRDGAAVLNTAIIAGGVATWAQTLASGLHVITASYAGDATNSASVSTATSIQISADGSVQPAAVLQWNYQYDAQGNLTQVTDANAAVTQHAYDSLSRSTQITQPVPATGQAAPVIGLAYDLLDQPASVTDPRSLTTSYTTDGLGNTTALTSPDTGASTRTYYDNGLLHTAVDARGRTSTYTYDALDRLSTVSYSDGGTGIVMGYDAGTYGIGHLTSVTDESGSTWFVYDGLGHVVTKTQVSGPSGAQRAFTLNYAWGSSGSAAGKLTSVTYPSGAIVTYGYDTAGRVNDVSVTGADSTVTKVLTGLSYNALNQPQSWVWGIGAVPYLRSFDGYGRLVSYPLGNPSGTGVAAGVTRTLVFDAAGRIVGYSHTTPTNWDQVFAYDGLDRLVSASLTTGNNYGYSYDLTGNRTQTTINGTPYAVTVAATSNWYTNVSTAAGGATAQGYDAAGHLTSDANGNYTYSGRGRLQAALRSGNTFSYLYNAFEQRVYKAGPSPIITTGVASYVYDEAGHLVGEYDATGKAAYETVYLGDMPVAALTQPAIGQTTVSYVYADHLNTARVIVRPADQAIVWSWGGNEPFGQTQANSNPNSLGVYTYNPRFPGQIADAESGWFYNGHRDYNPALGRYVQSDPIGLAGGSMSTYAYVNAQPLSLSDPSGLMPATGPMPNVNSLRQECDPCAILQKSIADSLTALKRAWVNLFYDLNNQFVLAYSAPIPGKEGEGSYLGHVDNFYNLKRQLRNQVLLARRFSCQVDPEAIDWSINAEPPMSPGFRGQSGFGPPEPGQVQ